MSNKINPYIFRAYDIRGIYGKDLTPEVMKKIGMAAGTYRPGNFTVGRDFRSHGKNLEDAFVSGLLSTGSNATLIGTCPTSLCVFANWVLKNDIASYITGSHLTSEWNGIKFFYQDGVGFFEDENKKLGSIAISEEFKIGKGYVKTVDVEEKYIDFINKRVKPEKIRIVVDFGNGAACIITKKILKKLGVESSFLFDKPDPNFSNRNPEPTPDSLSALSEKVEREGADLGIAFDGDGDRALYVDDKGSVLASEQATILFLRDIMKVVKGTVIVNVECSSIIDNEVKKLGGNVVRIPVGHTFLVQEAKKRNAILGIEKSGHICIPKFFWFDDAIINSMYMIEIVSKLDEKVSDVIKKLPIPLFKRIEINCPDEKKFRVIKNLKKKLISEYENINTIDGVRIDFPDSWVLIRASNTSPIIRLSIEARSEAEISKLSKKFSELIQTEIGG